MSETSYNGWAASPNRDVIGLAKIHAGPTEIVGGVRHGDVAIVLGYVAQQIHTRVQPLTNPGCWGYAYRKNRNANNLSCHASGTAIDVNAPLHPNGKHGTFTAAQVATIRKILAECGGLIRWGGDFSGTKDEMHFEVNATPAQIAGLAARLSNKPTAPSTPTPGTSSEEFTVAEVDKIVAAITAANDKLVAQIVAERKESVAQMQALRNELPGAIAAGIKAAK